MDRFYYKSPFHNNIKFNENPCSRYRVDFSFHEDGRTDMTMPVVSFYKCGKTQKKNRKGIWCFFSYRETKGIRSFWDVGKYQLPRRRILEYRCLTWVIFGKPRKVSVATDLFHSFGGAVDAEFGINSEHYVSVGVSVCITCVFFYTSCAVKAYWN